jgi:purine-cytosine permease-like protein
MPRRWVICLIAICVLLNGAGFLWDIFEPWLLYDEIAHVITPFTLVAITAEIIYRRGGDDEFFDTPRHALVTGSVIGFVGAVGWECIEILLDYLFPAASIDHSLSDTFFDVVLGVIGGAAGAWLADRYLDRLFNRSRWNSRQPKIQ